MEFSKVGLLIVLAIGLIVGLVLLSDSIADNSFGATQKTTVVNESLSISAARTVAASLDINTSRFFNLTNGHPQASTGDNAWRKNAGSECYVSNILIVNSTGTYTLVQDTDYVLNTSSSAWDLKFLNTSDMASSVWDNQTKVTYSYCGSTYVAGSSNQSILALVVVFSALALAVFSFTPVGEWLKEAVGLD